jgi:hypothetical protein
VRSDPPSDKVKVAYAGESDGGETGVVVSWGRAVYMQGPNFKPQQQQQQQQEEEGDREQQQQEGGIPCMRTRSLPPMHIRPAAPRAPDSTTPAAAAAAAAWSEWNVTAAELAEAPAADLNIVQQLRRAETTPVAEDEAWRSWFTSRWRKARNPYRVHTPHSSSQSEPFLEKSADGGLCSNIAAVAGAAVGERGGLDVAFLGGGGKGSGGGVTAAGSGAFESAAQVLKVARSTDGELELLLSAGLPGVLSESGVESGVFTGSADGVEGFKEWPVTSSSAEGTEWQQQVQRKREEEQQKRRGHRHLRGHPSHLFDTRHHCKRRLVPHKNVGPVGTKAGAVPR